jgi:hypothetical protein
MRYLLLGAAAIAAVTLAPPVTTPASAEVTYPWCGKDRYGWGGCTFSTLEQCRAFIAGANGRCESNPRYAPSTYNELPARARR